MATHRHSHDMTGERLRNAFFLTLVILVVEVVAGYAANSLALLSDAGHILTDAFALGLAWFAARLAARPADERNTFGYQRSSILAALLNAAVLLLITVFIGIEAFMRVRHPEHVQGGLVIVAALLAIVVNAYIAFGLRGEGEENLNVRAALLHVTGDIAASVAVIVAGVVILVWGAYLADPLLSFFIALLIAYGAWQIVRDTVLILMEGTPRGVDLDLLREAMSEVPGVTEVHDLHVWALSDGFRLLTAHVLAPEQSLSDTAALLADLKLLLRRRFHIEHSTIEVECVDCRVPQRRPIQLVGRDDRNGGE
jgi:cobalt-zinc-cadmium efflux system protein